MFKKTIIFPLDYKWQGSTVVFAFAKSFTSVNGGILNWLKKYIKKYVLLFIKSGGSKLVFRRMRFVEECACRLGRELIDLFRGWTQPPLPFPPSPFPFLLPPSLHPDNQRWEARASLSSTTLTISNPRRGSLAKLQLMPFLQQVVGELSRHAWPITRPVACIMQKKRNSLCPESSRSRKFAKKERKRC